MPEGSHPPQLATALALAALAALVVLAAAATPASAGVCETDSGPAATLLAPWFEVDADDPGGRTTLISIDNASPESVRARVVLWTDLGVPTFAFDLVLTGWDVQSINLRDVFDGLLPPTGPGISPVGELSDPLAPAVCDPPAPGLPPAEVPVAALRAAHRGEPSGLFGGDCGALAYGDGVVRGYATIDLIDDCPQALFPTDPGYFPGTARFDNLLWGDVLWVDPAEDFAQGENLARVQADPEAFGPGDETFYGRYLGASGADGREPLPAAWAARYLSGGAFTGGTDLVVWRAVPPPETFACGGQPSWFPLGDAGQLSFDEEENVFDPRGPIVDPPIALPVQAAAQRVDLAGHTAFDFGWYFLDLDPAPDEPGQAWVVTTMSASGRFSVGETATPLGPGCRPPGGAGAAAAGRCAVDLDPAATLLLPYFEVDLGAPDGRTTLMAIANASAGAVTARVVLWTDLGVPTFAFDVLLTGWDVQTVNLRDVFDGLVPDTGPGVSPVGELSEPVGSSACDPPAPGIPPPGVPAAALRAAHTGAASDLFGGRCGGRVSADGAARGYATVDVVDDCPQAVLPTQPGYFDGTTVDDNVLWGDVFWVDPSEDFAQGDNLVRLQADPAAFGPGDRTFYGRYHGDSGVDGREPLPGTWAARYLAGGAFTGGTQLVVWRETPSAEPFPCGDGPSQLLHQQIVVFDEEENAFDLSEVLVFPGFVFAPFADAAQRVDVQDLFAFDFGWVYLDLDRPPLTPAQAWVTPVMSASGRFSVGEGATPLAAACEPPGCPMGEAIEVGRLCVLRLDGSPGTLEAGDPVRVQVYPAGCFSSSCTHRHVVDCTVGEPADGGLEVAARFCLQPTLASGTGCTADCSGGGSASCLRFEGLAAGTHTVTAGGLSLELTIPAEIAEFGGVCVGDPF